MSVEHKVSNRLLVIASPGGEQTTLQPFAKICAQQLRQRGMNVELAEGKSIDRFQLFKAKQLLILGRSESFFSGKVYTQQLSQALSSAGGPVGKQAYTLLLQRGMFNQRALLRFMKILEGEGLLLLGSAVVNSASAIKAQLHTWQFYS